MPPAARISDMHTCPMSTGPVPHVGGPVMIGCVNVLIGGMPAARVGDMVTCCGPPDTIAMGSPTVFIGGMPAARMGDMCAHGGVISMGFPQVNIGEMGGAPSLPSLPTLPGFSFHLPDISLDVPHLSLALPHLTVPVLKGLHLPSLLKAFGSGLKEGIFNEENFKMFVGRAALVAMGVSPELIAAGMAVYGAYSFYKACNDMGNGDPVAGLYNMGKTLAGGSAEDRAHLLGTCASIVIMDKADDKVDEKLVKPKALTELKNADKFAQADKIEDGSKAIKRLSDAGGRIDKLNTAADEADREQHEHSPA